jgi:hypothetical protein
MALLYYILDPEVHLSHGFRFAAPGQGAEHILSPGWRKHGCGLQQDTVAGAFNQQASAGVPPLLVADRLGQDNLPLR